jgi:hypothetical protein
VADVVGPLFLGGVAGAEGHEAGVEVVGGVAHRLQVRGGVLEVVGLGEFRLGVVVVPLPDAFGGFGEVGLLEGSVGVGVHGSDGGFGEAGVAATDFGGGGAGEGGDGDVVGAVGFGGPPCLAGDLGCFPGAGRSDDHVDLAHAAASNRSWQSVHISPASPTAASSGRSPQRQARTPAAAASRSSDAIRSSNHSG